MRLAITTLIGGFVMFVWGLVAHMVLPLGEVSMRAPLDENRLLDTLRVSLPAAEGVYVLPYFDSAMHGNDQATQTFVARSEASPYAFIVYQPRGRNPLALGHNLFHQWLSDTLSAFIVALVLTRLGGGIRRSLRVGLGFGVFSWLSLSVPFWNWYRFPAGFTAAYLAEQAAGWLLAGAAMGWYLSRPGPVGARPARD